MSQHRIDQLAGVTQYAKEKFGNAAVILCRDGSQQARLLAALKEVMACNDDDFPSPDLASRWQQIREEAGRVEAAVGRVPKTIAQMNIEERSSLERQLLDLAERIAAS